MDSLKSKGIVNGVTADLFRPDLALSEPQGVQLIVNAFGLKMHTLRLPLRIKLARTRGMPMLFKRLRKMDCPFR